jgi:hypothetical protein
MDGCFIFNNTLSVSETPFAWNALMERFRMNRALTIQETAHNVWETIRYGSYTDEALYFGTNAGAPTVYGPNGLRYYRGGYTYMVSIQDRTDLINSGLVDASYFTPCPGSFGYGPFGSGPYGGGTFGGEM